MSAEELVQRRTEVARLTGTGLSQRAIAEQLGITRDAVVRDQRIVRTECAASAETESAPVRTDRDPVRTSTLDGAEAGAHQDEPVDTSSPAGASDAHQPVLVLELDDGLAADLAVLVREGGTFQEAVRTVVADVAATYRTGVRTGVLPEGPFLIESMALAPVADPPAGPRPPL